MGIFDQESDLFTRYHARILFRDKVLGGTPRDPKVIEGWLRAKAGIQQEEEVRQAMLRTLIELGADVRPDMSYEEMAEASEEVAGTRETTGFKRDSERGLYLESRQLKAMLKEVTNVLYAGQRVGATKKGPKSYLAERVFVNPDHIYLGRCDPDSIELVIGHVNGPKGPQSTLGYHETAIGATVEFEVMSAEDSIPSAWWPRLWVLAQELGLGALRSQGYGRFDIVQWDKLASPDSGYSG